MSEAAIAAPPAAPVRVVARPGWHWLTSAAEMAAEVSDGWPAAAGEARLRPTGFPRVATRTPGVDGTSVRAARDFTIATLLRWGITDRQDDIVVVVSELLTNALRHARPSAPVWPRCPVRLGLLQPGPCVLCAVSDPSAETPQARDPGWFDESGRGLHVVDSLSDGWGCTTPTRLGKVVWATFTTGPGW